MLPQTKSSPEIPVAVDIGHQLEEDDTGDHDQNETWDDWNGRVVEHGTDWHADFDGNDTCAESDGESLVPLGQMFCCTPCLGGADHLLCAGSGSL